MNGRLSREGGFKDAQQNESWIFIEFDAFDLLELGISSGKLNTYR